MGDSDQITVVYDNRCFYPGLTPDWGFSCLVRTKEETILFDTCWNQTILLDNMKYLGINPLEIDSVVLSHRDQDHIGGLDGLLSICPGLDIYLPLSPNSICRNITRNKGKAIQVRDVELISGGIMVAAWDDTLSLLLETEASNGLVMFASRMPEKVLEMIRRVKELRKGFDILLLIAAFCHFSPADAGDLANHFKSLGVRKIAPCHCCDQDSRSALIKEYGNDYIPLGVGSIYSIPWLL